MTHNSFCPNIRVVCIPEARVDGYGMPKSHRKLLSHKLSNILPNSHVDCPRLSPRDLSARCSAPTQAFISPSWTIIFGMSDSRMDCRPPLRIRLRLAQNFPGHGGNVTLAAKNIVEKVQERITLRPIEVCMRYFSLVLA